jgi:predicted component of type VI protein secretion system
MALYEKLKGAEEPALASIARNLEAVLNAKKGHAAAVEVFGLGNYDRHFASKPAVNTLIAEMTEQVLAFEPRLMKPRIEITGRDPSLWVHFDLTATYAGGSCRFRLLFHSVFRNVRVSLLG